MRPSDQEALSRKAPQCPFANCGVRRTNLQSSDGMVAPESLLVFRATVNAGNTAYMDISDVTGSPAHLCLHLTEAQ